MVNAANSTVERAEAVVEAVTVGVVATATVLTGADDRVRAVVETAEVVTAVGRMAQAAKRGAWCRNDASLTQGPKGSICCVDHKPSGGGKYDSTMFAQPHKAR